MELWRISDYRSLTGEGGLLYSARWHTAGRSVVYMAATPAGAMLEVLVHLELEENRLPPRYTLLRVEIPDDFEVATLVAPGSGPYKGNLRTSRRLGDGWLAANTTVLARVPSAILPNTWNYLLNPKHPDAGRLTIAAATKYRYDARLLRTSTP